MFKWILAVVGALLIGIFIYWQANSVKEVYVNGLAPYEQLPGREFIVTHDCYIFKFKHHDSDFPLLGANDPGAPMTVSALPREVSAKNIGADLSEVRILGIVRAGARFTIAAVRRDKSRTGTKVTFEVLFSNRDRREYPRVDAYWIMDHAPEKEGKAPTILPDYAVPETGR